MNWRLVARRQRPRLRNASTTPWTRRENSSHSRPSDGVSRRREFVAAAGLAAALPHTLLTHGRQVGAATPRRLAERTARLRRLDNYLGGGDTREVYAAEVASTTALVRDGSYSETIRRQLLAILAEQAQLAGWAAFDAGEHHVAERYYRTSLAAAGDAEDRALMGNALAFLSYQQPASGHPATETASAACETAGASASPRVLALLHLRICLGLCGGGGCRGRQTGIWVSARHGWLSTTTGPSPTGCTGSTGWKVR